MSESMESNAYLVKGDLNCVIDPGIRADRVLNHERENNIGIDVLINTHCHFDHVGANPEILEKGSVKAYCHEYDARALEVGDDSLQLASLFGCEPVRHGLRKRFTDGDVLDLGGVKLEVIHTPGHTRGSICLYESESQSLFTGDTLFSEGVGRTDFKGGSWTELSESLNKIASLRSERGIERIYPGHGLAGGGEVVERALELYF